MSGDWRAEAACAGDFTSFFGPEDETKNSRRWREARARTICSGCPSRLPCLQFALDNRIEFGLFGGMSESERAALRREQGQPALCGNGLHLMTGDNIKAVAGRPWVRCRACATASDQRTAAARRDRRREARAAA